MLRKKPRIDLAKFCFFVSATSLVILFSFLLGAYSAVKETAPYSVVASSYIAAKQLLSDTPMTVKSEFGAVRGLQYFDNGVDRGFLLLSGYLPEESRSGIKLIRLSDGRVMKSWYPDPVRIRERSDYDAFQTADRFEPQSPLIMDDGGLIFIDNQGPLVRIDACSNIKWIRDGKFHHSLERSLNGTLFVPFVEENSPDSAPIEFRSDAVAEVGLDGRVLRVVSVADMLLQDEYRGLLFGVSPVGGDPIHLNDVEVARFTTSNWKKGDWLLSLRNRSAIILYRPSADKVIWVKQGPWTLQHDPDFLADGRISIFGNDVVQKSEDAQYFLQGFSNVYVYDPASGSVDTPYERVLRKEGVRTPTQGKSTILEDRDVFIEETDRGRLIRAGRDQLVWAYYNTYGDEAGVLHWSRYVSAEELSSVDFNEDCASKEMDYAESTD